MTVADAESADDAGSRAADWQHLDIDDAGEHKIVAAVEQHLESDLAPDTREARTNPQVIPRSQLSIFG
jgi:hypothetical protein